MLIKICGITRIIDAMVAVESGAGAIGFVFADSPRQVTPAAVREIIRQLPEIKKGRLLKVGVFVNAAVEKIVEIALYCGLNAVQLHGCEPPACCRELKRLGFTVIKAFRVREGYTCPPLGDYLPADVDFWLLDAWHPLQAGGSGQVFAWHEWQSAGIPRPFILAGGLTPANVGCAVELLRPDGVDVSSGVELPGKRGIKNHRAVRDFIAAVNRSRGF